jgi:outer membrane protein assembly factor BamE
MITRLLFCTVFAILVCSGCGLIYTQNIQQGNALEQDDLDELYEGMNKRQVLFVLGTPSVMDPFHQDRWDYVQTFSRRGSDMVQRTVTLHFKDDQLTEIIGRDDPFAAAVDETPGDTDEVAQFTKKPEAESDPKDAAQDPPKRDLLSGDPDEVASFTKKPDATNDPHEAALEAAEEDVLADDPDIDFIDERTSEDREYQEDMDVLDQRQDDGLPGPDIDG